MYPMDIRILDETQSYIYESMRNPETGISNKRGLIARWKNKISDLQSEIRSEYKKQRPDSDKIARTQDVITNLKEMIVRQEQAIKVLSESSKASQIAAEIQRKKELLAQTGSKSKERQ